VLTQLNKHLPRWKTGIPDLAIVDALLAAMNGIDLAIRIKPEWPHCQHILFSGQAATSDRLDLALKNGHTFDVLAKPVHPSELLEMAGRLFGEPPIPASNAN
jgi:CheY-like chemotaxis protein